MTWEGTPGMVKCCRCYQAVPISTTSLFVSGSGEEREERYTCDACRIEDLSTSHEELEPLVEQVEEDHGAEGLHALILRSLHLLERQHKYVTIGTIRREVVAILATEDAALHPLESGGKPTGACSLKDVLDELNIPPDFEVKGVDNCDKHIDYIHRQTDAEDIYFISNSNQTSEKVTCVFRVDKNRVPEIWDAETGLIQRQVEYSIVDNRISIDFILDPLASRFVIFRDASSGKNDAGLSYDLQYGVHKASTGKEDIEWVDISNNWNVRFYPEWGGPESYQLEKLISWSDMSLAGIKYYSGKAIYSKDFVIDEEAISDMDEAFVLFEELQEMARVSVNGNDCGIVWVPPYKARITPYLKAGTNHISVEVINTWNNRIVGDLKTPDQKPFTNTNAKIRFNDESPLLNSGLIGKVEVLLIVQKD